MHPRSTIEKLVGSNEELKASNEEAMSRNEEPQSANEELSRVNAQLQAKVDELAALNEDLEQRVAERTRELESLNRSLHESQHSFQLLAENVPSLFAYNDAAERYCFVNKGYAEAFQTSTDRILGRTIQEVIGDDAYGLAKQHIDGVLAGREQQFERPLRLGQARERWQRVQYVPDFDETGSVQGFFTLATDITEVKRTNDELRASRDRLQAVLRTAADAIVTIDSSGIVESFNKAAERIFGYNSAEVVGRNVSVLMPEPWRSEHDGYIRRYRKTRQRRIIGVGREVEGRRKNGTVFPVDLAISEVEAGRHFTGIIHDLTLRKRYQRDLKQSHRELQSLSARLLTAEEDERKLIARELHDDFSQRLAMLSIELEALKAGEQAADRASSLDGVVQRLGALSDDIHRLAYSLHPSILDHLGLSAALRKAVEEFSERHQIETLFRERGPTNEVSPQASNCFYRIAQECLTNTAKHSATTRVTVRLFATTKAVRLTVRDYGGGFDVETMRRQIRSLGLVGMEERARLVGGTLTIQSAPGRGTTVKATCPLETAQG